MIGVGSFFSAHHLITTIFANQGGQYFEYGLMRLQIHQNFQDKRLQIFDAPFTLIFMIGQPASHVPFLEYRWPIVSLWKNVPM